MQNRKLGSFYAALLIVMPQGRPDVEILNFNLVESQNSARTLEMHAQKAQMFQKDRIGLLHEIKTKVWSAQNSIYEISSKTAAIDTSSQDFLTEGATSISTPDRYTLLTENIRYNSKEGTISGNQKVTLKSADEISQKLNLTGTGLNVFLKTDIFRIENNVKAQQTIAPRKSLNISSQKFEFDSAQNIGRFLKKATVTHPEYNMRGDIIELLFDKTNGTASQLQSMYLKSDNSKKIHAKIGSTQFTAQGLKLVFDAESNIERSEALGEAEAILEGGIHLNAEELYSFNENGVQKIRMTNNVLIKTATRTARCEEALFIPSTGDFILEKIASLKEGEQLIEGEKIFFSTSHNKLRVEKATGNLESKQFKNRSN